MSAVQEYGNVFASALDDLAHEADRIAKEHGFTDATPGEDLMLIVTEAAEAMEELRRGKAPGEVFYKDEPDRSQDTVMKPCGVPSEIADIMIRCLHFCGKHEIPIGRVLVEKMIYNDNRPHKHGNKKL
jgi:hypothetical protein